MKRLILFLLLWEAPALATSFTEFYCVGTSASNLNSGHTTNAAATYTGTGFFTNNTSASVCTWFKSGEDLSGVTNGAWASIYTNTITTNAVYVGRVTAVDDTADTITVSLASKAGTVPTSDADGNTVIKVGGAWAGPNTNTAANGGGFPFNFVLNTMTNTSQNVPRVNFLAQTYLIAAAMTTAQAGPVRWQGYASTPGDGGKASVVDSTTAASYVMLTVTGANHDFADFVFTNAFSSGASDGIFINAAESSWTRVVFHDGRRDGFTAAGSVLFLECEAYNCNKGNTAVRGGFNATVAGATLVRCVSRNNSGSLNNGFVLGAPAVCLDCVAFSNGNDGFHVPNTSTTLLMGCDSWNNAGDGFDFTAASAASCMLQNCNALKNTGYGVNSSGSLLLRSGDILNCGFGSGTQTNTSGNIVAGLGMNETNAITYASGVTPWVDPTNGNFTITAGSPAAFKGRGNFTQTTINSPTNTVSYPSIGASSPTNSPGAGGGMKSFVFGQ